MGIIFKNLNELLNLLCDRLVGIKLDRTWPAVNQSHYYKMKMNYFCMLEELSSRTKGHGTKIF